MISPEVFENRGEDGQLVLGLVNGIHAEIEDLKALIKGLETIANAQPSQNRTDINGVKGQVEFVKTALREIQEDVKAAQVKYVDPQPQANKFAIEALKGSLKGLGDDLAELRQGIAYDLQAQDKSTEVNRLSKAFNGLSDRHDAELEDVKGVLAGFQIMLEANGRAHHSASMGTFPAPLGGVVSGEGVMLGGLMLVAKSTAEAGDDFTGQHCSTCTLPKEDTTATFAIGDVVYWDKGVKEESTFDFTGLTGASFDVAGNAKYFEMCGGKNQGKYSFYFNVTDGANTQNIPWNEVNFTPVVVDVLAGDTPAQLAAKFDAVVDALDEFNGGNVAGNVATVQSAVASACADSDAATSGVAVATTVQGVMPRLDVKASGRYPVGTAMAAAINTDETVAIMLRGHAVEAEA